MTVAENKVDGDAVQEELALEEKETVEEAPKENTETILKDIRDQLGKPAAVAPAPVVELTPGQRREALKEQTGMTDAQLDFHERSLQAAIVSQTAPLREKAAWSDLKEQVGVIEPAIAEEMKKELAQYSPQMRGDSVLVEKVYYMTVGRMGFKKGATTVTRTEENEDRVVQRRVVSGTPGSSVSLSSGGGAAPKGKVSDEERGLYRRFGIKDDAEWLKYKNSQTIGDFKK